MTVKKVNHGSNATQFLKEYHFRCRQYSEEEKIKRASILVSLLLALFHSCFIKEHSLLAIGKWNNVSVKSKLQHAPPGHTPGI